MKKFLIVVLIIVALLALVVLPRVNTIPTLDENIKTAASQLDSQYKRRSDLIPNLVATVKGYASHEKDVFTEVTNARAKVGQITLTPEVLKDPNAFKMYQQAQDGLSSALTHLMAVSENYPDLKANENFLALQSQLEGTENRIAVARKDYIDSVQKYNIELRTIPGKWIAALLYPDATVKQNFTATPSESATPKVSF